MPSAVKNMIDNTESSKKREKLVKNRTPILVRQPYMGTQEVESDTFEENFQDHRSNRDVLESRDRFDELEPTIQDWSTEVLTEDIKDNLVVNLEHLINEESWINHISDRIQHK